MVPSCYRFDRRRRSVRDNAIITPSSSGTFIDYLISSSIKAVKSGEFLMREQRIIGFARWLMWAGCFSILCKRRVAWAWCCLSCLRGIGFVEYDSAPQYR